MAPKSRTNRGLTVNEKKSVAFETITLYLILLVAVIAAVVSFFALSWVGRELGMGNVAMLVPLAIDGFAVACSVGIVRSQASGERWARRVSEWGGLIIALSLSIAGNVQHALIVGSHTMLPKEMVIGYSSAIPVIVAYGIHVYGKSLANGVSSYVLAEDRSQVHLDIERIGARAGQPARARRQPRAIEGATRTAQRATSDARAQDAPPAARIEAPRAQEGARAQGNDMERARAMFDEAIARDPGTKPDAASIHRALETDRNPATTRRWVAAWWDEQLAANPARDPIAEQLDDDARDRERESMSA